MCHIAGSTEEMLEVEVVSPAAADKDIEVSQTWSYTLEFQTFGVWRQEDG
jgi:hypothetical protein